MITKINDLLLKGLSQTEILGILQKEDEYKERRRIRLKDKLRILLKRRSRQAVAELREEIRSVTQAIKIETVDRSKKINHFRIYRKKVWEITERQDLHTLDNHDKRGFKDHHLDHKISIWDGFKKNIPAEVIGSINNLRFIPHRENMLKGRKSI